MKFAFLQNNRLRLGLVTLIFSVSVATVILVRASLPVILSYDNCALVESAVRFSKTGVASSALFPGFTEVITDPHPYPEMRWWATGAPKLMGTIIRLSLSPEAAFRAVNYAAIALMWLGWFLVVKEAGRLELLSRHPLVAAGFCLCPLFLTPNIDIDEMLFAAFVPWIIWLKSKTLSSRKWWLYLCILLASFWAGYQVRHASLMFPLLAMSAFGIVLLRKQETKSSKTRALLSLLSSMGIFLLLLYINSSTSPEYFAKAVEKKPDVVNRYLNAVKYSGYTSLSWLVNWFIPTRLASSLENKFTPSQTLGLISLASFYLAAATVIIKSHLARTFDKSGFFLFAVILSVVLYYTVLLISSLKNQAGYVFTSLSSYWYPYLPVAVILPVLLFRKKEDTKSAFTFAVCSIPILLLITMLFGINKKALSQIRGYYFEDDCKLLSERLSYLQATPKDFLLPEGLLTEEDTIYYTQFPQYFSLMYPNAKVSFRPPPTKSQILNYQITKKTKLIFSLPKDHDFTVPFFLLKELLYPVSDKLNIEQLFGSKVDKNAICFEISEFSFQKELVQVIIPIGWRAPEHLQSQPVAKF